MLSSKPQPEVPKQDQAKTPIPEYKEPAPLPIFKGSKKRRIWQYIDNFAFIIIAGALFFAIDALVDIFYKSEYADTQSSAQQFTIQDFEGVLLALIVTAIAIAVINLILELYFDAVHWFVESEADSSWNSFVAFKQLTPFQQWLVFLSLFYVATQVFVGVLGGIT